MKDTKNVIYWSSVIIFVYLIGCKSDQKESLTDNQVKSVKVEIASAGTIKKQSTLHLNGQVEAAQSVNISTRVTGYITKLYVKMGDRVEKGQHLFSVNSTDITAKNAQTDAMIVQAQAALDHAKKDFDRFTILYQEQSATAKELENATLQYQHAKAGVQAAIQVKNEVGAQFAYTEVVAPFNGIVAGKFLDAGSLVTPGAPVITLDQKGSLQINALVGESEIKSLIQGEDAIVQIKSVNRQFTGKIIQMSESASSSGGQYQIKISIPEEQKGNVNSGMYVNVEIPIQTKNTDIAAEGVWVPETAIFHKDELCGIYTVSSNKTALLRWVRTGKTVGNEVEVISGLSYDEKYITHSEGILINGTPVTF